MKRTIAALFASSVGLGLVWAARADVPDAGTEITLVPIVNDAGAPPAGYAPDPEPPLVTRKQWIIELGYRSGTVVFGGARKMELAKATPTPRAMGRFAIELHVGKELVDRVRFDFPLLGAEDYTEGPRRWDSAPSFERFLSTRAAVMVPESARATRATLVDRASGKTWALPFPFDARAAIVKPPS